MDDVPFTPTTLNFRFNSVPEPVNSVEARTRYSFDGGEATQSAFMFNRRGTALFFTQQEDEDNEFIKRLARSTTLQINPVLSWAGSPIITFETEGAAKPSCVAEVIFRSYE